MSLFDDDYSAPVQRPVVVPEEKKEGRAGMRSMPYSPEAEMGVLSCLLQAPMNLIQDLENRGGEDLMYHTAHRLIFRSMLELLQTAKPVDLVSLSHYFLDHQSMDQMGGPAMLAELYAFVPTPAHFTYYCEILREKRALREVITTCAALTQAAYGFVEGNHDEKEKGMPDWKKLCIDAQARLFALTQEHGRMRRFEQVGAVMDRVSEHINEAITNRGHVTHGIATGFTDLDRTLMGLKGGQVFIIGGRTSMGKSAMAANIAESIALANGHYDEYRQEPIAVGIVTLEMSAEEIMQRMTMSRAEVNLLRAKDGFMNRAKLTKIVTVVAELTKAPLYILDTGNLSIQELPCYMRQAKTQYGHKKWVWIVDYLQKLKSNSRRAQQSRQIEIGEISSGLKEVAKELDDPIIVCAQIARSAEKSKGSRPQMSDLRESGDIEQDADIIGLLYRIAYYQDCPAGEDEDAFNSKACLILDKNRNGGTGDIPLRWTGELARYTSVSSKLNSNSAGEQQFKSGKRSAETESNMGDLEG